ncbi:MAG: 4Fe-4S dicluster domain-containing protein [Bacillota bacterium]
MTQIIDITDPKELRVLDPVTFNTAALCEQCGKCGSVCPALIRQPNPTSLIRLVQLGSVTEALHSPLLWTCIGCEQCNAVCPQKLDVAHVIRRLRRLSAREKDVCFPGIMLDFLIG